MRFGIVLFVGQQASRCSLVEHIFLHLDANITPVINPLAMKSWHAAALALVGWYLLAPPFDQNHKSLLELPLSQWHQWRSFDTATDCETYRKATIDNAQNGSYDSVTGADGRPLFIEGMDHSLCIATDDPRLK